MSLITRHTARPYAHHWPTPYRVRVEWETVRHGRAINRDTIRPHRARRVNAAARAMRDAAARRATKRAAHEADIRETWHVLCQDQRRALLDYDTARNPYPPRPRYIT